MSPDKTVKRMRRDTLYILGSVSFFFWLGITYFLFLQKPSSQNPSVVAEQAMRNKNLEAKIEQLDGQLRDQLRANSLLLNKLVKLKGSGQEDVDVGAVLELLDNPDMDVSQVLKKERRLLDRIQKTPEIQHRHDPEPSDAGEKSRHPKYSYKILDPVESGHDDHGDVIKKAEPDELEEDEVEETGEHVDTGGGEDIGLEEKDLEGGSVEKPVIPLLLFSCNRVTVNRALDLLLTYRPSKEQFPIIVTQDCGHKDTASVIASYGDQIISIQQPDLSEPVIPAKEKKFKGYFKIARHYGWALNKTFMEMAFDQVVVVEDDLEISPDFFEYFSATLPILRKDKSLWCVSAWNDNGKTGLINETAPELLYRTDFFPGLGWMLTKELWTELMVKWPRSYWDDWMREPAQRKGRSCIRPEVSRTKTFGKIGVSNGLFFDKHLKYIMLNKKFVPFTVLDLSFLTKENYDEGWVKNVYKTPVVTLQDLKGGRVAQKAVRVTYHTREAYKRTAKALGIMDDFKSGVPRMAYRGIVSFMHSGVRVFLAPNNNWLGYDPKWA